VTFVDGRALRHEAWLSRSGERRRIASAQVAGPTYDSHVLTTVSERIRALQHSQRTVLIGIDGRGGSGKSALARDLAQVFEGTTIVQFDDFYRPSDARRLRRDSNDTEVGGDFDWRRVRDQVLRPLSAAKPARYQRYDWDTDSLAEWHEIRPGGSVIVEGTYAIRPELRDFYHLTVWVDAPHDIRLQRGLERDGEHARHRWLSEWMPEEDRYIEATQPKGHVDVVIDGSGVVGHGHVDRGTDADRQPANRYGYWPTAFRQSLLVALAAAAVPA
jgi:uridine kinase